MQVVLKGGCQGTFGVDGSHWRHTQYNGVLALLTGRDGNGKNVALAMGIFAVENVDNWNWFFRMVKRSEQMAAALNRLAHRAWIGLYQVSLRCFEISTCHCCVHLQNVGKM